jgi:Zn-dependent protease
VATALVFYACLLAHELARLVIARRNGMEVEGIVLWLFGGVSQLKGDATSAPVELRMALAGPFTNLGLGTGLLVLAPMLSVVAPDLLAAAVAWLGLINVLLALFNLLPAFPLDGGRVLRALLWRRWTDKLRATTAAARAGRSVAMGLVALGAIDLAVGAELGGMWLVFLGWFLLVAAGSEARNSAVATARPGQCR